MSLVTLAWVEVSGMLLLMTVERLRGVRLGVRLIWLLILLPSVHHGQLVLLGVLDLHRGLTRMMAAQGITTNGRRSELWLGVWVDAIEKIFNLNNLALDGRVMAVLQLTEQTLNLLNVQVSERWLKGHRGIRGTGVSLSFQDAFGLAGIWAWILVVPFASFVASLYFRLLLIWLTRIFWIFANSECNTFGATAEAEAKTRLHGEGGWGPISVVNEGYFLAWSVPSGPGF